MPGVPSARDVKRTIRTSMLLPFLACMLVAQDSAGPTFDVSSIKPGSLGLPGGMIRWNPGGAVRVTNMSLKELIEQAYGVHPFQISGGPAWLDSARYDVNAKPENPRQSRIERDRMLQSLLADRFQLTIHRETRELPVYALVLARKDGKLGPKLTESKEGPCAVYDPANPPPFSAIVCGTTKFNPSHGWLTITSLPLDSPTKTLAQVLGRTVIDKTGLAGKYDMHLEWGPEENQLLQLPPGIPNPPPNDGPAIFVAVQEQLGLKLESQKGPVEVLVIDRAEKPSEN
jgi:uncharacterized protein (TIGR03435 family)